MGWDKSEINFFSIKSYQQIIRFATWFKKHKKKTKSKGQLYRVSHRRSLWAIQ